MRGISVFLLLIPNDTSSRTNKYSQSNREDE
jgi:hypothetical protein